MEQQVLGPDGRSTASRRRASLRSPFHPHSLSRAVEHVAKAQKPRQYNDVASIHWLWPELNRASFATGIYTWDRRPGGDVPTPERRAHTAATLTLTGRRRRPVVAMPTRKWRRRAAPVHTSTSARKWPLVSEESPEYHRIPTSLVGLEG
jgi:hypothetical protein